MWVAKWSETQPNTPCDLWQNSDNGTVVGYDGSVDTDVTRSDRFMALVRLGMPKKEEPPDTPDADPPDFCPIDGPCESPLDIVAAFLRTDACRELFKAYVAGKENKS